MGASTNPLSMQGLAFIEFAGPDPDAMDRVFQVLGFSRLRQHRQRAIDLFQQNAIYFLLNREPSGSAAEFSRQHGPCVSALGWYVADPQAALEVAVARGAKAVGPDERDLPYPAVAGIGDSLIYLLSGPGASARWHQDFIPHPRPLRTPGLGLLRVDHLTNNVHRGTLDRWSEFYREIFGFTELRRFDIDGEQTGLLSYALRSPDGSFCIPINEGKETQSQIDEYLRDYKGPGVQHIALLSEDLLGALERLDRGRIDTLDIDPHYYDTVFDRVPGVAEDPQRIREQQVLVDGDRQGYLLQIFTRNLFGPIFFELIQRRTHQGFGEGNFQALFESIERDQRRRGVL